MKAYLIRQANIVNEGKIFTGDILIEGERIAKVIPSPSSKSFITHQASVEETSRICDPSSAIRVIDASGKYLLPGIIDDHVHFRDPGFPQKGDIYSESKAAVAGGVTSFMDMPNTDPPAVSLRLLEQKSLVASEKSLANFSFFLGATRENLPEIRQADPSRVCGVKVFTSAAPDNLLITDLSTLESLFRESPLLIAIHAEDEAMIKSNLRIFIRKYGDTIPISAHPLIRSAEACFKSSEKAVNLASRYGTRLHLLHLSTALELSLLDKSLPLFSKRITGEVCVHHLWFNDADYAKFGSRIKWNPAIKTVKDQQALLEAVQDDTLDLVATDHAPHLLNEKANPYNSCPSGAPMIQHSLVAMLEFQRQQRFSIEKIIQKMAHNPAILYHIAGRGFIREGYYADLTLVDLNDPWVVSQENILYRCGWTPLEKVTFHSRVLSTWVNGHLVYDQGAFDESVKGKRLIFKYG